MTEPLQRPNKAQVGTENLQVTQTEPTFAASNRYQPGAEAKNERKLSNTNLANVNCMPNVISAHAYPPDQIEAKILNARAKLG